MKRFYKVVSSNEGPDGWSVELDGRAVKTPMKAQLVAPTGELANALVAEWAAQGEMIEPETMPLTQIVSTQIDRVSAQRGEMGAALYKYLDTDLLCYRAADEPPQSRDIAQKQAEIWDPWLAWFEREFGVALKTTSGLAALTHPKAAHEAVRMRIEALDDARFTALQLVVPACGSLILGLAFLEGAITPAQVLEAARVEENLKDDVYDAEKYGRDPMLEKKDAALLRDLEAAAKFLELL